MDKAFTEPHAEDEFYFQWHLTERCNWACKHCYQDGNHPPELPLQDLFRIVDIIESAVEKWGKQGTLSLTGGEPFIRRNDLYKLMDHLDDSKNIIYYDILTNGSCITEKEAERLAEHPRLRRVQVSLEGASAESNDYIRGEGSFDSILNSIRILRAKNIDVVIMTTITRKNKEEIPDLVNLLGQEGVEALALERFIPEGNGADLKDLVLDADEARKLYENLYDIAQTSTVRLLLYRPLFSLVASKDPTVGALCSAGNNALTIMPDGTVYPCRRLPIPIGNILKDGLYKIWYGSDVLWQLRDPQNLKGKCRNCDLLTQCRGCRAMAYFVTGDYMGEDPQCWKQVPVRC